MSSAIIDKYIGESARLIREMFGYARDHQVRAQIIREYIFPLVRNLPRYIYCNFVTSFCLPAMYYIYG